MRRFLYGTVLVALTLGVAACSSNYSSPAGPSGAPAPPAGTVIIDVVAINGAQSFSPNPAMVPWGKPVVWHNVDNVTHRVVLNDGELDTGPLAPGAFSQPASLVAARSYHCSIHPEMIGRLIEPNP
jgi:plastocyanin